MIAPDSDVPWEVAVTDAASADNGADVVVAPLSEAATEEVWAGVEVEEAPPGSTTGVLGDAIEPCDIFVASSSQVNFVLVAFNFPHLPRLTLCRKVSRQLHLHRPTA